MSQIAQLLKYQLKDAELLAIEQDIANSEARKKYAQAKSFMKKASEKLDQLEGKSQEILNVLEKLNKKYTDFTDVLKDFEHLDELVDEGADISFYQRNASQIADSIKSLKGEIANLSALAKETADEYQALKKKVIATQKQYPVLQEEYQKYSNSKKAAKDAIAAELEELSKELDVGVLHKYQVKRSERIAFPIICAIKMDRCSKCGTELSIASKEIVAAGKVIECENCHRLLYLDK